VAANSFRFFLEDLRSAGKPMLESDGTCGSRESWSTPVFTQPAMALIDTESLLQPVSPEEPTGTNLEYDPAFAELERAVLGKPEQQMGGTIVPGEPPDWNAVEKLAATLLARSKDLRVAGHLVRALLHRNGFEGFSEGLTVVHGMLERYWQPLYPHLDPDDNNDPTIRINALATLTDGPALAALRSAPLVRSRAFGPIGLRTISIASGELSSQDNVPKLEIAAIEAAFQDCPLESLEGTAEALRNASVVTRAIDALFSETLGVSGPDLTPMVQVLRQAMQAVQPRLEKRRAAAAPIEEADAAQTNGTGPVARFGGEIRSRDDVVRALDKICDYYRDHEPSSPLPLLLERCKRLATMSFIEIVQEMVPDGMAQVEIIAGKRGES
jgi:type VI secretion system protein ImpA